MNVIYLLKNKFRTVQLFLLIVLSPKLVILISGILTSLLLKYFQLPVSSAFMFIVDDCFNYLFTGKLFKISEYITQVFIPGRHNQVQMITHQAPAMQYQSFFSLAEPDAIKNNITVIFSCKDINPFN